MRNRRRQTRSHLDGLRLAIDCMPLATREAMLEGVRAQERILVGAYVDDQGGVCPMLAAHRCGGRTDFLSFAKSWDRFARPRTLKGTGTRAASEREVRILIALLEDSLERASGLELDRAIAEHHQLMSRTLRRPGRRLPDEGDPSGEIRARRLRLRRRGSSGDNPAPTPVRRPVSPVSTVC